MGGIKPTFVVIFYIKKEILSISFADLKKEVKKTFEKIGLLE
jgi:RNase P protein component